MHALPERIGLGRISKIMAKHRRFATVVVALLLSSAAHSASDPQIARVETGLLPIAATKLGVPGTLEDRLRAYGVPGLSVAVIDAGKIAWAKGYGVADTGSGRLVTTRTLFQAASISKPVSALGVLVLVQKGFLQLDENVNDALKSWKIPENDFTRNRPVTVRMLLNHTAGVGRSESNGYVPFSVADKLPSILQVLRGEPPARSGAVSVVSLPGKSFAYSGAGYEILQQLLVDVSGKPFEQYMQTEVLDPIGMANSTFAQPLPESLLSLAATGHYAGGKPLPGRFRVSPELAVAGLWTTPTDIAKYVINVQRSYAGAIQTPLSSSMTRQMLTPGEGGRGLGPAMSGRSQSIRFGHDGFNEGFESAVVAYVHNGQGAVVMANSGFAYMLIREVFDSISHVYGWPEYGAIGQQPPSASIHQQLVVPLSADVLASSPGQYELDNTEIRIHRSNGRLFLEWPGNGSAEVFATPGGRFFCPQLIFSDVGSPWLQFIQGPNAGTTKIMAGDDGSIELRRVN